MRLALLHMDLLGQQSLGKSSKHISTKLVVKDGDLPLVESVKKITLNKKRSGRRFKPQNSNRKFRGEGCVGFPISTVSTHLIDWYFLCEKKHPTRKPQRNALFSMLQRCVALSWQLCPTLFAPKKSLGRYHLPVGNSGIILCQSQKVAFLETCSSNS